MVSTERTAVCRKPDELRLLKMASTSGSTAAASTSSEKSYPSSTGSCGTACTIVDGVPNSSSRVPRRVFSTRGRDRPGAPAAGERGAGPVSRAKLKTVKLTAAVVLSYFVCWSPFFITQLWSVWDNEAPYQGTIIKKIISLQRLVKHVQRWPISNHNLFFIVHQMAASCRLSVTRLCAFRFIS